MKRVTPVIIASVLLLLLVGAVVLMVATPPIRAIPVPKKPYPRPPLYPQAQDVQVSKEPTNSERIVRFTTPDSPQRVMAFYDQALRSAGWKYDPAAEGVGIEQYSYRIESNGRLQDLFSFGIYPTRVEGQTHVRLRFLHGAPGIGFPPDYPFPPGFD